MKDIKNYEFATQCIHSGNEPDKETGAIERPITMSNSYVLPYDPSTVNWSSADDKPLYTRNGGANQMYLQERLALLEGGEAAVVLSSGVAALSGTFFSLLKSGDHVIFSDVTYIAVYRLLNELFNNKFEVETTILDTSDLDAIKKAIKPNTKLIHIESPGNPTLKITDIEAVAKIAHEHNILLSVDNTFSSPFNQKPLELGADIVIESLTKYINGHGDAMGGAVVAKKEIIDQIKAQAMVNLGGTISPFNAWLIMRGSTTLPLRMEQHNKNGQAVAEYLESLPCVTFVAYPGLKSFKGHDIAKKQMKGFSGMLSFGIKAAHDKHNEFVSHLKLITSAVSLGHGASLIAFLGEDDERQYLYPEEFHNGFFRMSVGTEDAKDIIADLEQAFKAVNLL
ncbi:aminotransferase class I/II-fold pyridoxal phosphate-dependent enzyme [Lachnospiraceae bacterium MD329]|nr:aminotransferase class I/II-fold pyridoxal phosphate-dependent enzyme [Lachnospiraceae bacterium MD329]